MKLVSKKVLLKQAKEFEAEESQKWTFSPTFLFSLEVLFEDVNAILYPKPCDYQDRSALIMFFDKLTKKTFQGAGIGVPAVAAFGSFIMDMFTSKSDLDLSVNFNRDEASFPREKKISLLRKLSKALFSLQSKQQVLGVTPILKARVPILKCVDRRTGVECDISVENKDGIIRSGMLRAISSIDKRFRPLCYLMKAWAKAHNINSSKDHTFNSLSIILLVALHFQTRTPPIFPPFSVLLKDGVDIKGLTEAVHRFQHFGSSNQESLAALFVTLLIKLWAVKSLWPLGLCASTYEGTWTLKPSDSGLDNINVEEFTERSQNVARSVGKPEFEKIYSCIKASLGNITAFMEGQIETSELKLCLFGTYLPNCHVNTTVQMGGKRSFPVDEPLITPQDSSKRMRNQGLADNEKISVGGFPLDTPHLANPLVHTFPAPVAIAPSVCGLPRGPTHDTIHAAIPVDGPFVMAPQDPLKRLRYQGLADNGRLPVAGLPFYAPDLHNPLDHSFCAPVAIPSSAYGLPNDPAHEDTHAAVSFNPHGFFPALAGRGVLPYHNQQAPFQHNSRAPLHNEWPFSHRPSAGCLHGYEFSQGLTGSLMPTDHAPPALVPPNPHYASLGLGHGNGPHGHHPQESVFTNSYGFQASVGSKSVLRS